MDFSQFFFVRPQKKWSLDYTQNKSKCSIISSSFTWHAQCISPENIPRSCKSCVSWSTFLSRRADGEDGWWVEKSHAAQSQQVLWLLLWISGKSGRMLPKSQLGFFLSWLQECHFLSIQWISISSVDPSDCQKDPYSRHWNISLNGHQSLGQPCSLIRTLSLVFTCHHLYLLSPENSTSLPLLKFLQGMNSDI